MIVIALTVLLAAAPPTGFTTAVERVALVKNGEPLNLDVNTLSARMTLRGAKLAEGASHTICPAVELKRGALVFTCTTRRVWAAVVEDKSGVYLDVRELRGLPPGDDSLVLRAWPLESISIPGGCPGEWPGPRGECALADGNLVEAKKAFLEALGGADTNLARLRLGDFAMREGDLEEALARYSKISFAGPIGRLAKARACDLTGGCFTGIDAADVDDYSSLAEPLKTEMELYMMRRHLLNGEVARALEHLAQRITEQPPLCEGANGLCQHLVWAGLEDVNEATRINALSAYMSDGVRYGPFKNELALAASAAAERLGAPGFAAAVLSSISPAVPAAELDAHLLKVAQLFLSSRDRVRSGFILEYADGRLGYRKGKAWQAVRNGVAGPTSAATVAKAAQRRAVDVTKLSADVELSTELARAATIRSRALANRTQETAP